MRNFLTIQYTKIKDITRCYAYRYKRIFFLLVALLIIPHSQYLAEIEGDTNKVVKSQLESTLIYNADDSIVMDMKHQIARLYNNAHIDYGEIVLDACYIEFDFESKEVLAKLCIDSTGEKVGIPELSDGETTTKSDSLKFNFESKRGITYHVKLQEGEGYVHGTKVKRQSNGDIHIDTAMYTTCDLDHPHYYFKLRRAIIKPDDKIVSGPVNLYIADIPTPLGLPFGYFPNKKNGSNGLVIPSYGQSVLGFYLLNGGYYHKFKNEKIATAMLGDIYSKGSWGLKNNTSYKVKYKYNGKVQISYNKVKTGDKGFPDYSVQNQFFIRWQHTQDSKARPNTTFSANINAGTSRNFQNTYGYVQPQDYLSNNFNSNVAFGRKMNIAKGKLPANLSLNFRHNQNNTTKKITFTLPEMTFNLNRFYPFSFINSNNAIESNFKKQLNKIGINYNTTLKNQITIADSSFSKYNIDSVNRNLQNGMRHSLNASTSIHLLNHAITFNPSYQLNALMYLQETNKFWNGNLQQIEEDTVHHFTLPYWQSFRASFTSKIYGFYKFAKFLTGKKETTFRHTLTPSLSYTYIPENSYMQSFYTQDIYGNDSTLVKYSPYQRGLYGSPPTTSSNLVGFSLINAFEMKQKNLNDTTGKEPYKKLKLMENFTISGTYDFNKDSMNLSIISFTGRTKLYKNVDMRFGASLDPYYYDSEGTRTSQLAWTQSKQIGTFTNSNLALNFRFQSKQVNNKPYTSNKANKEELEAINANSDEYVDFNKPWTLIASYKISRVRTITPNIDTVYLIQTISINGDISITKNWKIEYMTNYDFVKKKFSYTSFNIMRDLHCWEMRLNWIPFGYMKSYNIQINVKAAVLQELRLQRRRTWYDNGVR